MQGAAWRFCGDQTFSSLQTCRSQAVLLAPESVVGQDKLGTGVQRPRCEFLFHPEASAAVSEMGTLMPV